MAAIAERGAAALVLVVALLAVSVPARAWDAVYRYIDDRGVVHFTNIPTDDRYRPVSLEPAGIKVAPRPPSRVRYDTLIETTARRYGLAPALVKAVIAAESAFDPDAVSHKGAQGLMQLMPQTASELGVEDAFQPADNVRGGARYLREMLDRYGDVSRALAAYNAGPNAVDRHEGIPPYPETQAYVARVLQYFRGYHDDFRR